MYEDYTPTATEVLLYNCLVDEVPDAEEILIRKLGPIRAARILIAADEDLAETPDN